MSAPMTRTLLLALGTVALLGSAAVPARADDDDHWRHERHGHEWREHHDRDWCWHHPGACGYPGYYYAPPPVVYAPPPVVYAPAPPPVVYAPAPSLNIVIPFR